MKIIHTSDWHIGQNFYRYDRLDEHQCFIDQLAAIMARERPDALVVSGDIFHTSAPSSAAQKLFVAGVMNIHDASPQSTIVITAGNHDSGSRLDAERLLWQRLGIHVVGGCERNADGTFSPSQFIIRIPGVGSIIAVPHFHPSNYPLAQSGTPRDSRQKEFFGTVLAEACSDSLPTVLMAHMAVEGCNTYGHEDLPIGGMDTDPIDLLGSGYDYLALGHIHMSQQISPRAYYSGSPLPISFSEDYEHHVNIVEIARHGDIPQVRTAPIKPLRKVATIPPEGAPIDQALQQLADLDPSETCYVRLLIDQDSPIPADAEDRARQAVEGKACRFCEVRRKPKPTQKAAGGYFHIEEVDDFNRIAPIDIAKRCYKRKYDCDMDPELEKLMNEAIKSLEP